VRPILCLPLLLVVSCKPIAVAGASDVACAADGHLVVVETRAHTLWLCSERRAVGQFKVALGRGGLDKKREGDGRTPLGTYSLGSPRPSARFGTFIPIGYPTPEQSARGFTGKDVGIHGPDRRAAWLGALSTWIDWTAGCVATGTDEELRVVAAFVRDRSPRVVLR
jgi:murein L,D-transpeptidase YafK